MKLTQFISIVFIFCVTSICFIPQQASAWGPIGHRIVGEIAESYLTPTAKTALKKILGNESIALASTWADFIRSDSAYDYLTKWHYINVPSGLDQNAFVKTINADTGVNAYQKIQFLIAELKKPALSLEQKRLYVRMLIHIVGDVHQPLHLGKVEDHGGNKIKLNWFDSKTNLHALWDEGLINFQQLSYTEYTKAINLTSQNQRLSWQQQPLSSWLYESYTIAQQLYADAEKPDFKYSYTYNFKYIGTVNQRLLQAGVRLAGIFNTIFS